MEAAVDNLRALFEEAKQRSEFDFVLTLLNYQGMAAEISPTLHEWFEAISLYEKLYQELTGKDKTRMAALLYSTFFENSDFYNIIGSLCRVSLGYKGSSYLFWKTRKYERLLGIGEKQDFLIELLADAGKEHLIAFFEQKHHKEIRNTYFHAAYSLDDDTYHLHDSEAITIGSVGYYAFPVSEFFYPLVDDIRSLFSAFKVLYTESWSSYTKDKDVPGLFPDPITARIIGSPEGLKGFRITNAVQFYGKWHDSGIWYDEKFQIWAGHNMRISHADKETIEISDQLLRFENKASINRSDAEFNNLIDIVRERRRSEELARAAIVLVKFGDSRYQMMEAETNELKKRSYPKNILAFYEQAAEIAKGIVLFKGLAQRIKDLHTL